MKTKHLVQLFWISGLVWDDHITPELTLKWKSFVSDLKHTLEITIPRTIQLPNTTSCVLHGFSDASGRGYATLVYIRCTSNNSVSQLLANILRAPLQRVTVLCLDLFEAHLLAQLVNYCMSQFTPALLSR